MLLHFHSYSFRFRPSPDQPKPSVFLKFVWLIWANESISVFLWLLPLLLLEAILHVLFIDTVNCRHLHYLKFIGEKAQILFAKTYTGNDNFVRTDQD